MGGSGWWLGGGGGKEGKKQTSCPGSITLTYEHKSVWSLWARLLPHQSSHMALTFTNDLSLTLLAPITMPSRVASQTFGSLKHKTLSLGPSIKAASYCLC